MKTSHIAAALAAIGFAAAAFGQTAALTANRLGTPDDGLVCRTGYGAIFSAGNIKCSKSNSITVVLECTSPNFPTYVNRAPGAPFDNSGGLDICTRAVGSPGAINLGPTDSLQGLVLSTNGVTGTYEFAKVNPATVATRTGNADQNEATALGLTAGEVDTVSGFTTINKNVGVGGIKDNASVLLTHYTFAIPTGGGIIIGNPFPAAR